MEGDESGRDEECPKWEAAREVERDEELWQRKATNEVEGERQVHTSR